MTPAPAPHRADKSSFERVAAHLDVRDCRPRRRGDHLDARCPAHEDRRPSLSVDWRDSPDRGGFTVLHCHTGCHAQDVVTALGLLMADLFDTPSSGSGGVFAAQPVRKSASAERRNSVKTESRNLTKAERQISVSRPVRGWPRALGAPEAVYPYRDPAGGLVYEIGRWTTPEGKTFRARRPAPGRPGWWFLTLPEPEERVLYRLPELLAAVDRGDPVWLTEGERDADNLASLAGTPATTRPNGALKSPQDWPRAWTRVLTGAHVVIVADRDEAGYRHAAAVRTALGDAPASVRVVRTPLDEPKADASDHLDAGLPMEDFEPVPEDALTLPPAGQPVWKSAPAEKQNPAKAEPLEPADPAPGGRVVPGPWPPRPPAGTTHPPPAGGGEDPPVPALRIVRDEYAADGIGLYKLTRPRFARDEDDREARELMNVRVRLARRVRRDMADGTRPVVSHVDMEARRGDDRVDVAGVELKDFETLTWAADLPWSDVQFRRTASGKSDVVNAIVATSGEVPAVTAYGTMGWRRRDDGSWMYVHADGAIDAAGPVPGTRVDIPHELHCYALPPPPEAERDLAEAVAASTALLWEVRARISAPLLGAAYRAILGESSTTVFLLGEKGTFKSGLAATVLQHYAPTVRYNEMPAGAGEDTATMTSLEELRYIAGHMPFAADDLAPDRGVERSAVRANILARSQYNRKGKLRGKRDGGTRPHHPPRGLLLLTGEDGASAPSAESRLAYVPINKGDVPLATLKELTTPVQCNARAQLTAALVRWAAPRMGEMKEWVTQRRNEYAEALTDPAADPGTEARRAEAAGDLLVGWRAMLDAVVELGAMTQEEADDLWKLAWCGMADAKTRQAAVTDRRTLPERAADLLQGALVAGHAHIAGPDGGPPNAPPEQLRVWGWTTLTGSIPTMSPDARPNGDRVGWVRDDRVYLHPPATMPVLLRQSKAEGDPLAALERSLAAALTGAGLIQTTDEIDSQRRGTRHSFEHKQRRVWDLPVAWLFPDPPTDPADPPQPAPTPPPAPAPAVASLDPADPEKPSPPPEAEMQTSTSHEQEEPSEGATGLGDRPGGSASTPPSTYRGSAVVVDETRAYLVGPAGGGVVEMPNPPASLPEVLTWAEQELGTHQDYARDDYGQVWLTPPAAARYGLPADPPEDTAHLPVLARLHEAGWRVGGKGFAPDRPGRPPRWWVNTYREGGRTVGLYLPGWTTADQCPFLAPDPRDLATRLGDYGRLIGTPWQVSSAVTGLRALELSRTRSKVKAREPATDLPPPAFKARLDVPDAHEPRWQRPPEPGEGRWVHAYDLNAQYLAACASVRVGYGPVEHRQTPTFDPTLPGYWHVTAPRWDHTRLPDPLDPLARGRPAGPVWLTTPRMIAALELGWLPTGPEITEAYVWPTVAPGNRVPGVRYFEHWYAKLRAARAARLDAADPVLAAIKETYARGIGRLAMPALEGTPLFRPDWRHHIMGTAVANMWRKIDKAAEEEGRYPLALPVDAVLYASDDPNPETACPRALLTDNALTRTKLGQAKSLGTLPLADLAPILSTGTRPKVQLTTLFQGR